MKSFTSANSTDFLKTLDNAKKYYHKSVLTRYLDWKKNYPELEEKELLEKFRKDNPFGVADTTLNVYCSVITHFLTWLGYDLKKWSKKRYKRELYYENDPSMKDYLVRTGSASSKQYKRQVNRFLGEYCQFRKMTPTELVEESKTVDRAKIETELKRYYDTLTIKSKKANIEAIKRFYKLIADVHLRAITKDKEHRTLHLDQTIVDKQTIQTLLKSADLRDSMIIFALFESGMNPCDLVMLNYGDLKESLNLEEPTEIKDVVVLVRTRKKTNCEFLACFGLQTLEYMSRWLQYVKQEKGELSDEQPIFCHKQQPFKQFSAKNFWNITKRLSKKANLEPITSADFRNSFNTRSKKMLKHFDKELFMGHLGGIERHYDISSLEYYQKEYRKAWEILFDLSYSNEKVLSLEEENRQIKKALKDVSDVLEKLYLSLLDPKGDTKLTPKDLEQAIERIRKIPK